MAVEAAMDFIEAICRQICLDDRVMIGPSLFEAVRKKFDGLRRSWSPDHKTRCSSAKSANQPKNIFHCSAPFSFVLPVLDAAEGIAFVWAIKDRDFAGHARKQLHFGVWIRFGSVERLVSGPVQRPGRW
jgi:hypothetical protein